MGYSQEFLTYKRPSWYSQKKETWRLRKRRPVKPFSRMKSPSATVRPGRDPKGAACLSGKTRLSWECWRGAPQGPGSQFALQQRVAKWKITDQNGTGVRTHPRIIILREETCVISSRDKADSQDKSAETVEDWRTTWTPSATFCQPCQNWLCRARGGKRQRTKL